MTQYNAEQVLSGTHGELWVDDENYEEVTDFKAELNPEYADINKAKSMAKHKKLIGLEGKGEITLNKVTSKMMKRVSRDLQNGKITKVKVMSNLDDPDAISNERIVIYDAILEKATLADWGSKQVGQEKIPFTFTQWEIVESI